MEQLFAIGDGTDESSGIRAKHWQNAAPVGNNSKLYWEFDVLVAVSNAECLTDMLVVLIVFQQILLWLQLPQTCLFLLNLSVRANKITGMYPESALCFSHSVINDSTQSCHRIHLGNKYWRYERTEVGLCPIDQQCCLTKLSLAELRLYIGLIKQFMKYCKRSCNF